MTSDAASQDSPWAAPWERRRHTRVAVDLRARLHGPRGEIPVRTENLSAGGTLLRVQEADLCWVRPVQNRSVLLAVARMAFGAHLEVVFVEKGVSAQARLIRMVSSPDESDRLYLGCRFANPLEPVQFRRLGVPSLLATPVDPATLPPAAPVRERPSLTSVRVRPEGETEQDPGGDGSLQDIGDHLLTMRIPYGDPGELIARVGGRAVSLYVHDRGAQVWAASGHLLSVCLVEAVQAVELEFLTSKDPRPVLGPRLASAAPA